jgi:hypothetical protein
VSVYVRLHVHSCVRIVHFTEERLRRRRLLLSRSPSSLNDTHTHTHTRQYSSILDARAMVPGLGWARSCLDSFGCWSPDEGAQNPGPRQWMEMDLGRELHVAGVVTQGHMPTQDGLEKNHVKRFMVLCRPDTGSGTMGQAVQWETFGGQILNMKGGWILFSLGSVDVSNPSIW